MGKLALKKNEHYSLFLDRDGVINTRIVGAYVKNYEEFKFIEGVPEAIRLLNQYFKPVVVVSNQQGVGKGIMSIEELNVLHDKMLKDLESRGAHIDKVYACTALQKEGHFDRKPSVGMGLKAKKDFSEIEFKKSVMVGDSYTDMEFGKRLGMTTVLISAEPYMARNFPKMIDFCFDNLLNFAIWFENQLS